MSSPLIGARVQEDVVLRFPFLCWDQPNFAFSSQHDKKGSPAWLRIMPHIHRGSKPQSDDQPLEDETAALHYDIEKSRKRFQKKVALLQQTLAKKREERSASGASALGFERSASEGHTAHASTGAPLQRSPSVFDERNRVAHSISYYSSEPLAEYRLSPSPLPNREHASAHPVRHSRSVSQGQSTPSFFTEHSPPPVAHVNPRALVDEDEAGFLEADCYTDARRRSHTSRSMSSAATPRFGMVRETSCRGPAGISETHRQQEVCSPGEGPRVYDHQREACVKDKDEENSRCNDTTARRRATSRSPQRGDVCHDAISARCQGVVRPAASWPLVPPSPVRRPFVKHMEDFSLASPQQCTTPNDDSRQMETASTSRRQLAVAPAGKMAHRGRSHQPSPSIDRRPSIDRDGRMCDGITVRSTLSAHRGDSPQRAAMHAQQHAHVADHPHQQGRNPVFCLRTPFAADARLDSVRRQREEREAKEQRRAAAANSRMELRRREAEAKHQQRLTDQRKASKTSRSRKQAAERGLVSVRSRSVSAHSTSHRSVPRSVSPSPSVEDHAGALMRSAGEAPVLRRTVPAVRRSVSNPAHEDAVAQSVQRCSSVVVDQMADMYHAQAIAHINQHKPRQIQRQPSTRDPPPPRRSASADVHLRPVSQRGGGVRLTAPKLEHTEPHVRCHPHLLAPSESPMRQWTHDEVSPRSHERSASRRTEIVSVLLSPKESASKQSSSPPAAYLSPESLRAHNMLIHGRPRRSKSWENGTVEVQLRCDDESQTTCTHAPEMDEVVQELSSRNQPQPDSLRAPSAGQAREEVVVVGHQQQQQQPNLMRSWNMNVETPKSKESLFTTVAPAQTRGPSKRFTLRSLYGDPSTEMSSVGGLLGSPLQHSLGRRAVGNAWPPLDNRPPSVPTTTDGRLDLALRSNDDAEAQEMMQRIAHMRRLMSAN